MAVIEGSYELTPVESGWHPVTVLVHDAANATWSTAVDVSWSLGVVDGELWTGADCPFGEQQVLVELGVDGNAATLWFEGYPHRRVGP